MTARPQTSIQKDIVITDLDNTVSLTDHRSHHLMESPKDWEAFWRECHNDDPDVAVISTLQALYDTGSYEVWILTGRSDTVKAKTVNWLGQHNVPYDHLLMRSEGDFTHDDVLKLKWVQENHLLDRILMVFEDRQRVVDMWRKNGVPCFQVRRGDF